MLAWHGRARSPGVFQAAGPGPRASWQDTAALQVQHSNYKERREGRWFEIAVAHFACELGVQAKLWQFGWAPTSLFTQGGWPD
jgi:hypothetical protein